MSAAAGAFRCSCGALAGQIAPATRRSGTHLECFCADCRATHLFLGQPDPAPGGVHLFHITPDMISFAQGLEHLALMRLSPRGMLRWYAGCCNAPLFLTMARPGLPFAALIVERLDNPAEIGPARVQSFLPGKDGRARHKGAMGMVWGLATRMGAARLSGRWRQNPFFDAATGQPVVAARILTAAERAG